MPAAESTGSMKLIFCDTFTHPRERDNVDEVGVAAHLMMIQPTERRGESPLVAWLSVVGGAYAYAECGCTTAERPGRLVTR